MKLSYLFISLALVGAAPVANAKGDAEAGKGKTAACAACHGADGNSVIPINPSLAGQNASYLVQALKDYRAGTRKNAIMNGQAAALKDEDIADIAAYFSSQSGKLVPLSVN